MGEASGTALEEGIAAETAVANGSGGTVAAGSGVEGAGGGRGATQSLTTDARNSEVCSVATMKTKIDVLKKAPWTYKNTGKKA